MRRGSCNCNCAVFFRRSGAGVFRTVEDEDDDVWTTTFFFTGSAVFGLAVLPLFVAGSTVVLDPPFWDAFFRYGLTIFMV